MPFRPTTRRPLVPALTTAGLLLAGLPAHAQPVELVSKPVDAAFYGEFGNLNSGGSNSCYFSDDLGRIVFPTYAFNLFPDDRNADSDVLVHDIDTQTLQLASVTGTGEQALGLNLRPSISGDGRYVMFESNASNLGVTGSRQAFRHDLDTGTVVPVGFAPDDNEFSSVFPYDLSSDGRYAIFTADDQAWRRDLDLGTTVLVSEGIGGVPADSFISRPQISADGDLVSFDSPASNLVAGDANGVRDVYFREVGLGVTTRVEGIGGADPDGESELAQLSSDGRWAAFVSEATNLVPGDTEGQRDVFLHDRQTGSTIRVSEDGSGIGGNAQARWPAISADGRFVVFESEADNLVPGLVGTERRLFLYDRQFDTLVRVGTTAYLPQNACVGNIGNDGFVAYMATEHPLLPATVTHAQVILEPFNSSNPDALPRGGVLTTVISRRDPALPVPIGNDESYAPALAAGNGFLAFPTRAGNLMGQSPNGTQVVRLDLATGQLEVASLGSDGEPVAAPYPPSQVTISGSGNRIGFVSRSPDLVAGDTNDTEDIFVRDLGTGMTRRVNVASGGDEADAFSDSPAIAANGNAVAFSSFATNLVPGDTNDEEDVFIHRLGPGTTERVSVSTAGAEANDGSSRPAVSGDGRFVVFQSRADLLDGGPVIISEQIWVRDLQAGTTELVSATPGGDPGNGDSNWPSISTNGRWIVFRSGATDLDPEFPSPGESVFLHDRQTGFTQMVSLDEDDDPVPVDLNGGPKLAADGSAVLFQRFTNSGGGGNRNAPPRGTDPNGSIYVRNLVDGRTVRIEADTVDGQPPNAELTPLAIDPGGENIYLVSLASNLVPGMVNGKLDIYRINVDSVFNDGFEAISP